ncbi:hypothetical protein [Levilactobacillus humaensis]|uniref:hypothetical protein n=1 Tax=Levilactobacillus humaensis TaxID=2950375 RepID=UPI0021C3BFEF|nr:hypothetical protein [Levilactobacillus humaensis]
MVKVIARVSHPDTTGAPVDFRVIEVEERLTIFSEPIANTHRYWVPLNADVEDEEEYLEPVDDPDYNFRTDFAIYRRQYHFMEPMAIRDAREHLGLTQCEAAIALGMDTSLLADIEANMALQPYEQEVKLRWLLNPEVFAGMVRRHPTIIRERCRQAEVDADSLLGKLATYESDSHI